VTFNILSIPKIKKWIEQFDHIDRYAAENLLQSLKFVSLAEFERSLQTQVEAIVREIQKSDSSCIAVFPVIKTLQNKFNEDKESKAANDSSGRIGHALKNIERKIGKTIEISPRTKSMVDKKVRNIIYVDDYVGTGNRFVKFWRKDVSSDLILVSSNTRMFVEIFLIPFLCIV